MIQTMKMQGLLLLIADRYVFITCCDSYEVHVAALGAKICER